MMTKNSRFSAPASWPMTVVMLAWLVCSTLPAQQKQPTFEEYWGRVYQQHHVLQIDFTVSRENWDKLTAAGSLQRRGQNSEYVPATMVIDGEKLDEVGFRFKGNSSLRSSGNSPRKPLKVDTNRFVDGQKIAGCSKLNLSNVFADPTYLREKIGYEVFQAAGLPTPGVGWARVTLSVEGLYENQSLGLYVLVEQVNDDLLERQLGKDSKDSLLMKPEMFADWQYLGEDPAAYEVFDIKEGRKQEELIGRFASLLKLLDEADDEQFAAQVGDLLDLDNFAAYLAANSLLVNLDSFVATPHNYYLVMDEADGKLKILPWDLNMCFGVFSLFRSGEDLARWDVKRPWVMNRTVIVRLFQIEAFRQKYQQASQQLQETVFSEKTILSRIDELSSVVRPQLKQLHGDAALLAQQAGVEGAMGGPVVRGPRAPALKPFIQQRIASVTAQLAGEEEGLALQPIQRGRPMATEMTPLQKLWSDASTAELAGEYEKAIETVHKVIEMTEAAEDGYINLRLGWLYYLKRDYKLAVQHYATSAIALPRSLPPREGLMACYQALGDADRVMESAQGIVAIDVAHYQANKTLGDLYYGRGEYALASRYYLQLVTLNPADLAMVTNLGWCYAQMGQLETAEQVLNNVLTVNPQDLSARQGINHVQILRRGQASNEAVMKRLMAVLDGDQDGELSEEELLGAAAELGKLDLNKDGAISREELRPRPEAEKPPPSPRE